jgi:hydrogenase-4 component B
MLQSWGQCTLLAPTDSLPRISLVSQTGRDAGIAGWPGLYDSYSVVTVLIASGALLIVSSLLALPSLARRRLIGRLDFAAILSLAGCAAGVGAAGHALGAGVFVEMHLPWQVPFGSFALQLDPVAALFLCPIFVLGGVGIVYGRDYLDHGREGTRHHGGAVWSWYYVFVASMALVVLSANAVLFLVAWEAMSIAGFFLVTHEDDDPAVRYAGWIFLVATHIGTAFLLVMFALLGRGADTLDWDQLRGALDNEPLATAVVLLALVGFGAKAGLVPAHIWLPFAHPAAPSHVSALMSGAMLKVGIYGLFRTLLLVPEIPAWIGVLVLATGVISAIYGVLLALAQHDLKRLLAFHSVENIGIICIGLGVGLLGLSYHAGAVAALGFAGALLHVLNHALFKGLLFLGAGAVQRATGTREIDHLGGLLRRMPWTGGTFFVGAAAISGLPPLNGFISEFLIYLAAVQGLGSPHGRLAVAMSVTIGALALTGGLAAACFAKAFGVVFLGTPRTEVAAGADERSRAMRWPMVALAGACVTIGLLPFAALRAVRHATAEVSGLSPAITAAATDSAAVGLARVALVASVLLALTSVLVLLRARLLHSRIRYAPTWATGYLAPSPRMQYTASSFAAPLTNLFSSVLRMQAEHTAGTGYFPRPVAFATRARGLIREPLIEPLFRLVARVAMGMRWVQHGRIQLYLANIAATLLLLMLWKLGV